MPILLLGREMVGDERLELSFIRFRSEELPLAESPKEGLSWVRSEMENGRMACERIVAVSVSHRGIVSQVAESEGIEPLTFRVTPVFETGCRPFSGTLRVWRRGRESNPVGFSADLRSRQIAHLAHLSVRR